MQIYKSIYSMIEIEIKQESFTKKCSCDCIDSFEFQNGTILLHFINYLLVGYK